MVSYLPVGSEQATKWYAEQALQAGVGFVNAIPVFIGREPYWQRRFAEAGLPVIGDDIKSQVGATISHRVLTRLFMDRGVRLDRTYQLNFGGNTDFLNMLERERLESKKISKTNAVTSMLDYELDPDDVHVGPSDHVPWLLGPQVVLHPDGGHDLRRRAAQRRAQARGLGQPQQRRRHHRRHPLPEARPRPRPQGHARRAVELLHEEPAAADPRRHRVQPRRGVHPRRGQRDARRHREARRSASSASSPAPGQGRDHRGVVTAATSPGRTSRPGRGRHGQRRRAAPRGAASTRRARALASSSASARRRLSRDVVAPRDRAAAPAAARRSGRLPQLSYLAWPTKRALVEPRTSGTCSGCRPTTSASARMALRAYRDYGRYLVELMRLPSRPPRSSSGSSRTLDIDEVRAALARGAERRRADLAVGHVGSNEAVAAAIAQHGHARSASSPTTRRSPSCSSSCAGSARRGASSSSPGATCARSSACCAGARCSALLVDWGYRADGIPVRLFGAWTTLPAGPATLAAKTGSRILPITIRAPARRHVPRRRGRDPIDVVVDDPAELQRATQAIADALAATIAAAPEQWYSFKPIWPATADEAADLERRAALMQAGTRRARAAAAAAVDLSRRGRAATAAAPPGVARSWPASWLACRLPEGPLVAAAPSSPATSGTGPRPTRAAQARRNLRRVVERLAADGRGHGAGPRARRPTRAPSSGSSASPTATPRATTSRSLRTPACAPATSTRRGSTSRRPTSWPRRSRPARAVDLRRAALRRARAARAVPRRPRRRRRRADGDRSTIPELQAWFVRTRGAVGVRIVGLREARRELLAALRDGTSVGLVGDRDLTGGGTPIALFGAPAPLPLGPAMLAVETGAPVYWSASGARAGPATSGRLERRRRPGRRRRGASA